MVKSKNIIATIATLIITAAIAVLPIAVYAADWATNEYGTWYSRDDGTYPIDEWEFIDGSWYWFNQWGYMHTGWTLYNDTWYYLNDDGTMATGWLWYNGNAYYLYPGGQMAQSWMQDDNGNWYRFGENGKLMHDCWTLYQGEWYYLGEYGRMVTGWQWIDGDEYYFGQDGAMVTGEVWIDGEEYWFDSEGRRYEPSYDPVPATYDPIQQYYSATDWLIFINSTTNMLYVYHEENGRWELYDCWQVSCGAPETPTVTGQFTVDYKGYSFGEGYTCYYYSSFYGSYLMHSTLYYEGTFEPLDARLGMNLSHGCVRMSLENAKWIYDYIPYGTAVVVVS